MTEEKKVKNGTPFWWERNKPKFTKPKRGKFRKFTSAKKLLENLFSQD